MRITHLGPYVLAGRQVEVRGSDDHNLVLIYIYLAFSVFAMGAGITFGILSWCAHYGIEVTSHLWLLAIPPAASLLINVFLVELYRKITGR
jgi:hypothetical protein